jgi:uncharacterized protein
MPKNAIINLAILLEGNGKKGMRYRPNRSSGISPLWVIMIVCFIVFVAEFINPVQIFVKFALYSDFVGQHPWTLFSYMFVHGGLDPTLNLDVAASFYHIFFNMVTLYFFGTFALQLIGEIGFLITYFIGGIAGGLVFVAMSNLTGDGGVVGASGAIYALGGLLMVLRPNTRVITFPIPVPMPLWIAILVGFLIVSFLPGVAWQAHLGGIIYGALLGLYYRRRELRRY